MKMTKCCGCGTLIPKSDAVVDPFYTPAILCVVCEREWIEDMEARHEDEDRTEVERVCREDRMWDN